MENTKNKVFLCFFRGFSWFFLEFLRFPGNNWGAIISWETEIDGLPGPSNPPQSFGCLSENQR